MKRLGNNIPAAALPVVLVVSVIMLAMILGLLSLWEINFLHFTRNDYIQRQRTHIESFFTLYSAHPGIVSSIKDDSTFILYTDDPLSRLKVSITPWGLYESVCASSLCGKVKVRSIMGADGNDGQPYALWYRNNGSAVTLTGKTEIIGNAALSSNGIIYGQMQSVFFSGGEIPAAAITQSENEMPKPDEKTVRIVKDIFSYITGEHQLSGDSAEADFFRDETIFIMAVDGELYDRSYTGNIIITGEKIIVDATCKLENVILVGNYIEITDGVSGTFQAFAKDSINIGSDVLMDFPSGVYGENKLKIGERSIINGYVINNFGQDKDVSTANTVKDKTSKIRGLYYSRGISQLQGIITGIAYIDESVFYSPRGYYRNLIYDASFISNNDMALPLWFDREGRRKVAGWEN